jgi:hypothetical protein
VPTLRQFASDEAHARWWKVHDALPLGVLPAGRVAEALLRWDVAQAREANTSDGH